MNYQEALSWIYGLESRGARYELDRFRAALALRHDPQRALRVVHLAGSNGKGSTSAMIESALRAAGCKTGFFSSPHLHRYVERIRIQGAPIEEREAAARITELRSFLEAHEALALTFFELTTLMAFEIFRDHGCDIVVLEAGLGGRLDATNVDHDTKVSVITQIALEHTAILGATYAEIAREKAGIFREGALAVVGERRPECAAAIAETARARGVDLWWIDAQFEVSAPTLGEVEVRSVHEAPLRATLGLAGEHQVHNAGVAIATLQRLRSLPCFQASPFTLSDETIREGIQAARWPGRLEMIPQDHGAPELLFDCAHNPDGCEALARHLQTLSPKPTVLLFGALSDKQVLGMLAPLDGLVERRVYALPALPRSSDLHAIAALREGEVAASVEEGFARAQELAGPGGRVVIAGSIFLVQAARARALGIEGDPPIAL